jgi:hypothetical protein
MVAFHIAFSNAVPDYQNRGWIRNGPQGLISLYQTSLDSAVVHDFKLDLSGNTADVIPYNFHLLYACHATPRLKPVVQNYAANVSGLDELNAEFFAKRGPKYLLWHTDDQGSFTSIDGRSSWSDAPRSTRTILENYTLDSTFNQVLMLIRRKRGGFTTQTLDSGVATQGEWLPVSAGNPGSTWLDIQVRKRSWVKHLYGALVRSMPLYINLKTKSGDERVYRLSSTGNVEGIMTHPNPSLDKEGHLRIATVDSFRLIYDTSFYDVDFPFKLSLISGPSFLHSPGNHSLIASERAPEAEQVIPGGYSSTLTLSADSSWARDEDSMVKVYAFAHLMHEDAPDAQMVLEITSENGSTAQRAYINTPMTAVNGHNFARLQHWMTPKELEQLQTLKCYVWNPSEFTPLEILEINIGVETWP